MAGNGFKHYGIYTIILRETTNILNQNANETVAKILNDCWNLHIHHLVIIINMGTKYGIYTFYPYAVGVCSEANPVLINDMIRPDRWGNCQAVQIFTDKLKNFYGCPLVLATFHNAPHTIIRKNDDGKTYYVDGIDGALIRGIAERLNFKLNVIVADEKGLVDKNGTITGAFRMVIITR